MLEKILYVHTWFWRWDDKIEMELKEIGWDGVNRFIWLKLGM